MMMRRLAGSGLAGRVFVLSVCRGVEELCVGDGEVALMGQPEAIATLIRRTLIRTSAPILSSWMRIVPHVALANLVCCRAMRRSPQSST